MTNRDTEEKLRKLAAIDAGAAERGWLLYLSAEGKDRELADDLLDVILYQDLNKTFDKGIFLDPPSPSACNGPYVLGKILYPGQRPYCSFGLREGEWIKHVLITGMTGTGKTNLMFHVLREFRRHGKPFLIFDWKRNYRDTLQLPELSDMVVYTVSRDVRPFHFNPLIPPAGTEVGHWLVKLVDVLKHAYFVGEGVEHLLREGLSSVYDQCGFLDGSRRETPTFGRVMEYVAKKPLHGRMSLWKASTMRVLASLCFRHGLGPVVNETNQSRLADLLTKNVVLELDALSDVDKVFLTEAIILWIYEYRRQEERREQFKHAIVIEEGHHILSHKKENVEGAETIMETCLRQIREFGEAVVVIDQEPTKLSNSIKANTYCKITFNLGNGKDILEIANCMGLNTEESEYVNLLEVGHAIVSLKGRVFTPLLIAVPKVELRKGMIRDADLRA